MTTRVAVLQMQSGADVAANLAAAESLLGAAAAAGARLAVLPENFAAMGEGASKLAHAEMPGAGPIQRALAASARRHGLWIVAGTLPLLAAAGKVRAACLVFDASGLQVARYDKMHLFDVDVPGGETHRESAATEPPGHTRATPVSAL